MMQSAVTDNAKQKILVVGATGFVGAALTRRLLQDRREVVGVSRRPHQASSDSHLQWKVCDLEKPADIQDALRGVDAAFYLAHSMGSEEGDFEATERRTATFFRDAAAEAKIRRIVYLGGPRPRGAVSRHLVSRLAVGEILRKGTVPTVELRASMIIGSGSVSWQIVRDLAKRLPAMILPRWLKSTTQPVAIDDVVDALVGALNVPLSESRWFDIPGPEVLSGRDILARVKDLMGHRLIAFNVPILSPSLSALWLRFVTSANYSLAKQIVVGLQSDILAKDNRFWHLIDHDTLVDFDEAVRRALAQDLHPST